MANLMRLFASTWLCMILALPRLEAQITAKPETVSLEQLKSESLHRSPVLRARRSDIDASRGRSAQLGGLDAPTLTYMREEMPGFAYDRAMFSGWEIMQMIPFPTRIATRRDIGQMRTQRAVQEFRDAAGMILLDVEEMYYELWFAQRQQLLLSDNLQLVDQLVSISRTRYAAGEVSQQDILRSQIERTMIENSVRSARNEEIGIKAKLMAILDREAPDTLGTAVISDSLQSPAGVDSLLQLSRVSRGMLIGDSLETVESESMVRLMREEYLPDFTIGVAYGESPMTGTSGWSIRAGITLPFAPWTLSTSGGRLDEARAELQRSRDRLASTRNNIRGSILALHARSMALFERARSFEESILPSARQMLELSLSGYRTGTTSFLMLIDSYTMYVASAKESLMARMEFEQSKSQLNREAGITEPDLALSEKDLQP
jgi:outer membrane protein, heavy metal efflux system